MLKRLGIILLAICMATSCITFVSADTAEVSATTEEVTAAAATTLVPVQFFKSIGVIQEEDTILSKTVTDTVTRAEFGILVARLYNNLTGEAAESYFADVASGSVGAKEINLLAAMGIIKGNGAGYFNPSEDIKFNDALHMLVNALGYKTFAEINGGYYVGDLIAVERHNLVKKANLGKDTATVENIMNILFDAVSADMLEITGVGGESVDYGKPGSTILSTFFDIYDIEGVLESDGTTNINSVKAPNSKEVVINSKTYANEFAGASDLLGYNVTAFCRDITGKTPAIVFAYANQNNDVLEITSDNLVGLNNRVYSYVTETSNKVKTQRINPSAISIVYNGTNVSTYDETQLSPKDGYVKLIDNNANGEYDVLIVKSYTSFIVKDVVKDDEKYTIYADSYIPYRESYVYIDQDEFASTIKNTDGEIIDIKSVKINTVVSVAGVPNASGTALKAREIIVSTKTVSGALTEKSTAGSSYKITIDDKDVYEVNALYTSQISSVGIDDGLKFYLDYNNKIVYVESDSTAGGDTAYGYVMRAGLDTMLDTTVKIKMFNEVGQFVTYETAKRVTIDGVVYKNASQMYTALLQGGTEVKNQLIVFKINEEGKITYIDLPCGYFDPTGIDDNFVYIGRADEGRETTGYRHVGNSFGGMFIASSNPRVFQIPKDVANADEEDFKVIAYKDIPEYAYTLVEGYTLNRDSLEADAIIYYPTTAGTVTSELQVVTKITNTIAKNGEETYMITMEGQSGTLKYATINKDVVNKPYYVNNESAAREVDAGIKIEVGDIIRFGLDADNNIVSLQLAYDKDDGYSGMDATYTQSTFALKNYAYEWRIYKGKVYNKTDKYVQFVEKTTEDDTDISSITKVNQIDTIETSKFAKIIICEENARDGFKATVGSADDLVAYKTSGKYSDVVVFTRSGNPKMIFIYK